MVLQSNNCLVLLPLSIIISSILALSGFGPNFVVSLNKDYTGNASSSSVDERNHELKE